MMQALRFPTHTLKTQSKDYATWDAERNSMHEGLLAYYVAFVTETHERAGTAVTYARAVTSVWLKVHNTTLWPEHMFSGLKNMFKGMAKVKQYSKRPRLGLSAADLTVMISTINEWVRKGNVKCGWKHRWDERLAASFTAMFLFTYGKMFRFADATKPSKELFDPKRRLSRASVWFSEKLEGHPQEMTINPPNYKSENIHTGRDLVGEFDDGPMNWPRAIDHLLAVDAVDSRAAQLTPLFRDTRYCPLSAVGDGTYTPGGQPLDSDLVRRVIRQLVRANKWWFGNRSDIKFGVHSMRIGAMNDCLNAGCSYIEVCTLGRWTSDAVLLYHRMNARVAQDWHRKAVNTSLSAVGDALSNVRVAAERHGAVSPQHAAAATLKRKFSHAATQQPRKRRTGRDPRPRRATESGHQAATRCAGQTTLKHWLAPRFA
jgi:hypothetical protein